ncbi:MAG: glycine cleavage system protein H [Gammaproteobacteria bacterium SG8_31]|jgi:glycine cleavage system H protein|nr:MAG: glycine cleavage system protein H [Gammaproteobacteria bacterium SG8_31]
MSDVPGDLKYTKSHEWVREEDDGSVIVGITDHAQSALGDLVFVEAPETGSEVSAGDACAVVESVKAASDVYSPVTGEVIEANDALADSPELVNQDPYGDGWIMRIQLADPTELEDMLDAKAYEATLED